MLKMVTSWAFLVVVANASVAGLLALPPLQAAGPPLCVSSPGALAGGGVLQVALDCIFYNQGVPINIV